MKFTYILCYLVYNEYKNISVYIMINNDFFMEIIITFQYYKHHYKL